MLRKIQVATHPFRYCCTDFPSQFLYYLPMQLKLALLCIALVYYLSHSDNSTMYLLQKNKEPTTCAVFSAAYNYNDRYNYTVL